MRNFRVSFYKLEKEEVEKGKQTIKGQSHLGTVIVDDHGTGKDLDLTAKAFRHASATCQIADKVVVEEL